MRKNIVHKKIVKKAVLPIILIILVLWSFYGYYTHVGPIIDEISTLKSKGIITELINKTMDEEMEKGESSNLFVIHKDNDGNIQMVEANTNLINSLISKFTTRLQKKYNEMEGVNLKIPYGSILGSKILSQTQFGITVSIFPMSVLQCDFETDFKSEGINQTKYRIYIKITSEVRILKPFKRKNYKVNNKILIAETIIIGNVPNSYVNVPEEDILDVTDE